MFAETIGFDTPNTCKKCGAELKEGKSYCSKCGTPIVKPNEAKTNVDSAFEVILSEGEKIVKKYHCTKLLWPRCNGYIVVTNKRVIFYGIGDESRVVDEIDIDTVVGVKGFYGRKFDNRLLFLACILSILGCYVLCVGSESYLLEDAFIPVGLSLLMLGFFVFYFLAYKKIFVLEIYASATSPSISIGTLPNSFVGNSALLTIQGTVGLDTDLMLNEIGALIMDIKKLGEYALEKWMK